MAKMVTRDRDQAAVTARPRSMLDALFRSPFPELSVARDLMNMMPAVSERAAFVPSIELSEKDGNYQIDMALAGFKRDDIDIEVSGNEITVSGTYERKTEDRKTHYSEMQQTSFSRTIVLPQDVNADKVTATLESGMLHITVPPVAPLAAKKVAIKGET